MIKKIFLSLLLVISFLFLSGFTILAESKTITQTQEFPNATIKAEYDGVTQFIENANTYEYRVVYTISDVYSIIGLDENEYFMITYHYITWRKGINRNTNSYELIDVHPAIGGGDTRINIRVTLLKSFVNDNYPDDISEFFIDNSALYVIYTPINYEDVYNEGYNDGYDEGYYDGRNDGYDEGYDEGYLTGRNDGYDDARNELLNTVRLLRYGNIYPITTSTTLRAQEILFPKYNSDHYVMINDSTFYQSYIYNDVNDIYLFVPNTDKCIYVIEHEWGPPDDLGYYDFVPTTYLCDVVKIHIDFGNSVNDLHYFYFLDDNNEVLDSLVYDPSSPFYLFVTVSIDYNEEYNAGYDAGYAEGYNKGYNRGYNEGHEDGYDQGYEVGYEDGFDDGKTAEYEKGYKDGYKQGGYDTFLNDVSKWFGPMVLIVLIAGAYVSLRNRRRDD